MGFRKTIFGDEPIGFKLLLGGVLLIAVIANVSTKYDAPFTPPEQNTPNQYYGMPRPEPGRQINHFNHRENRFVYEDEIIFIPAPRQPQRVNRQQRRHRLLDELIRDISDDIRDDIEMSID